MGKGAWVTPDPLVGVVRQCSPHHLSNPEPLFPGVTTVLPRVRRCPPPTAPFAAPVQPTPSGVTPWCMARAARSCLRHDLSSRGLPYRKVAVLRRRGRAPLLSGLVGWILIAVSCVVRGADTVGAARTSSRARTEGTADGRGADERGADETGGRDGRTGDRYAGAGDGASRVMPPGPVPMISTAGEVPIAIARFIRGFTFGRDCCGGYGPRVRIELTVRPREVDGDDTELLPRASAAAAAGGGGCR